MTLGSGDLRNERQAERQGVKTGMPSDAPGYAVVAPIHLKGADAIADVFGVSRDTVVRWVNLGAPIRRVGKKYQARYDQLWEWILRTA